MDDNNDKINLANTENIMPEPAPVRVDNPATEAQIEQQSPVSVLESQPVQPAQSIRPEQLQPIRLEKGESKSPKKSNKTVLIAVISAISIVAIISLIIVLILIFAPGKETIVRNALSKLPNNDNASLSVDKKSSDSIGVEKLKVDAKNNLMAGTATTTLNGTSDEGIEINVYSSDGDLYVSGADFAKAMNIGLKESLKSSISDDYEDAFSDIEFDYSKKWIKMDASSSENEYSAKEATQVLKDTFEDFSSVSSIEVEDSKVEGSNTIYDTLLDGQSVKVTIDQSGNVVSLSGKNPEDDSDVEMTEIGTTSVDKIEENLIITQAEAMDETMDKFITAFTDYAVKTGIIEESQRSMFEDLMRDSVDEEISSSLAI